MAIRIERADGTLEVLEPVKPQKLDADLEAWLKDFDPDEDDEDDLEEEGTSVTMTDGYGPPPFPLR